MNECDSLFHVNIDKSSYVFDRWVDGDLLPLLDDALRVERPRKLIILHTIGSHWWYNSHFTEDYAQFQPIVRSKVISSCTQEEMVNAYDNTILYTGQPHQKSLIICPYPFQLLFEVVWL